MSDNKKTVGSFKDLRSLIGTGEEPVPSELNTAKAEFRGVKYTVGNERQAQGRAKRKQSETANGKSANPSGEAG